MPDFDHHVYAVVQELDNGQLLGEPLLFPEVSVLADRRTRLLHELQRRVAEVLQRVPPGQLYQRRLAGEPSRATVEIQLDPAAQSLAWRSAVPLQFPYVFWRHGREAVLAFVPALGIEVLVEQERAVPAEVQRQVRYALIRLRASQSLRTAVQLQSGRTLSLEAIKLRVHVRTPKQLAQDQAARTEQESSVLKDVVTDLTVKNLDQAFEVDDTLQRVADLLTRPRRPSILLVGPAGVGKTAAVHELVRRRREFQLAQVPFWGTSGSRLVSGMSGFGMWQERCQKLVREASQSKAVVHLENLVELAEVGKSTGDQQGIASFLRPYMNRGEMTVIAECTAEQVPLIDRHDPQLLDVFEQVWLEEPAIDRGRAMLSGFAAARGGKQGPAIHAAALETLDRLHRAYATYSAYPGRPLRFLRNLLDDRSRQRRDAAGRSGEPTAQPISSSEVTAAFSRETGLPLFLLDEATELSLEETRQWFSRRVLGQQQPVDLIIDLLATIKAGLSRPDRPIASLLFIGPTGVGKTEMAKALSEFMYSDPGRMIRFDMSEYADRYALDRLIGGAAASRGLLTDSVRRQPFTVVLLDEFEKAHPAFHDLLLQVLGEGRMSDGAGRVADFCNSIIIMTSNLGAESFGRGTMVMQNRSMDSRTVDEHFIRQVREYVRPEFFNRIDRIVPFAALDQATIECVARRELLQVRAREGIRFRDVALEVDDEVVQFLSARGYEPRYGARPLKRSIERRLIAPLAHKLNGYSDEVSLSAQVQMQAGVIELTVRAKQDAERRAVSSISANKDLLDLAPQATRLRRRAQSLAESTAMTRLQNELYRSEQLCEQWQRLPKQRDSARFRQLQQRILALRDLVERVQQLAAAAAELEDELLLSVYKRTETDVPRLEERQRLAERELDQVVLDIYLQQAGKSDRVCLVIFALRFERLLALMRAYLHVARERGFSKQIYALHVAREARDPVPAFQLKHRADGSTAQPTVMADVFRCGDEDELSGRAGGDLLGVGLAFQGPAAYPLFAAERGIHEFVDRNETQLCIVEVSGGTMFDYEPPPGIDRARFFQQAGQSGWSLRRRYDAPAEIVEDKTLESKFRWTDGKLEPLVAHAVQRLFTQQIQATIDPWT